MKVGVIMELDSATLVALIAAIAAIIAPVITSCVTGFLENRRHKMDMNISKMQMVYPEKQQAYLALAAELSMLVDTNGEHYDRVKLMSLLNRALILSDEKTEEALLGVRDVCFRGDPPWNYAVYALRQMSRELRDTQAQIDKSHRRCK